MNVSIAISDLVLESFGFGAIVFVARVTVHQRAVMEEGVSLRAHRERDVIQVYQQHSRTHQAEMAEPPAASQTTTTSPAPSGTRTL